MQLIPLGTISGSGGGTGGPVTSDDITDATQVGKDVLTAVDAAAVRTLIGVGTSNLQLGTTSTTAMAGNTPLSSIPAPTTNVSMASHRITNVSDPTGSQDAATKAYVDSQVIAGGGSSTNTYANAAPGTRFTLLYNGSGFVDAATGAVATARPSARADIYFDLIGGSSAVTDPAWMVNGDAREITS